MLPHLPTVSQAVSGASPTLQPFAGQTPPLQAISELKTLPIGTQPERNHARFRDGRCHNAPKWPASCSLESVDVARKPRKENRESQGGAFLSSLCPFPTLCSVPSGEATVPVLCALLSVVHLRPLFLAPVPVCWVERASGGVLVF